MCKTLKTFLGTLFILLSYSLSAQAAPSSVNPFLDGDTISLTRNEYETLRAAYTRLKEKTTNLEQNLLTLKTLSQADSEALNSSSESIENLKQKLQDSERQLQILADTLTESEKNLSNTKSALDSAKASLTESEKIRTMLEQSLTESEVSLKTLTIEINKMQARSTTEKIIIGVGAGAVGIAIGVIISALIK